MSICLDADALQRWVDGKLSDGARASALAHVAECSACRQAVSALAQLDTRFGERAEAPPRDERPPARRGIPGWVWIAGGAAAGAAIVVVAVIATRSPASASPPAPGPTATPIEDPAERRSPPHPMPGPITSEPPTGPSPTRPTPGPFTSEPPTGPSPTRPPPGTITSETPPTGPSPTRPPPGTITSEPSTGPSPTRPTPGPSATTPAGTPTSAASTRPPPGPSTSPGTPTSRRPSTAAWAEQAMASCVWSATANTRYLDYGPVEKREGNLVAITGRRARYVIDANEHAAGTLVANAGDLVALCPIAPAPAELPVGWGGTLWKTAGATAIAAPPGLAADARLVHASSIAQLMDGPGAWRLHAATRLLLPMSPTGTVDEDRHDMGGWWLEIPAGTPGERGSRRWVVATFARFTPLGDGRPVPVLRAIEIRAGLLGP